MWGRSTGGPRARNGVAGLEWRFFGHPGAGSPADETFGGCREENLVGGLLRVLGGDERNPGALD